MEKQIFCALVIAACWLYLLLWGRRESKRATDAIGRLERFEGAIIEMILREKDFKSEIKELNKELERRQHIINAYVNTEGMQ